MRKILYTTFTSVSIQNLRNQSGDVPAEYVLVHTPTASSSFTGTNLYVNGADTVTIVRWFLCAVYGYRIQ